MSTSPMMTPDPGPEDISAEELERWLQDQPREGEESNGERQRTVSEDGGPGARAGEGAAARIEPLQDGRGVLERAGEEAEVAESDEDPAPAVKLPTAETKRVRDLRHEVAEAHLLLALQGDEAALLVDTPKVRKRRMQAAEASRLHALAQNPAVKAWQAARWRLVLTWVAVVVLVLALGWSTAGVQKFAAEGAEAWTPGWTFAWLVEPFMSLALLTVVSARAFMATRSQPLEHPTLKKIERLFLGLTFGMNAWPHLPWVVDKFDLSPLVLHVLGPIVAVAMVTALPIIWGAFADLDHGGLLAKGYSTPTGPTYRGNAGNSEPESGSGVGPTHTALLARARELIDAGQLPWEPSATELRKALRCGTPDARKVRDALKRSK